MAALMKQAHQEGLTGLTSPLARAKPPAQGVLLLVSVFPTSVHSLNCSRLPPEAVTVLLGALEFALAMIVLPCLP